MALPVNIKQGEDKLILVPIAENGNPVTVGNLATLPTICDSIQAVIKGGQSEGSPTYAVLTYLSNDPMGEIQPHAVDTDKVYLKMREALTKIVPANTSLWVYFLIKYTDPDFSPDGQDKEVDGIYFAKVLLGHAKDL